MFHPATVICPGPCGRLLFEGGQAGPEGQVILPFADGQQLLTDFAETSCPVGGTGGGCPNTTEALQNRTDERPDRLRQLIRAAQTRLPRSRSLVLPALVANTPQEIAVTWPTPMPDGTYQVTIGQEFTQPLLLGAIRAAVKAGTRTATGCTLLVGSTRDVADGAAGLHVVATP
jgi:hypothetical protein